MIMFVEGGVLDCSFSEQSVKKVWSGADYNARKPYPKPWLQHIRGSDGERSLKISALKKNRVPGMEGNAVSLNFL